MPSLGGSSVSTKSLCSSAKLSSFFDFRDRVLDLFLAGDLTSPSTLGLEVFTATVMRPSPPFLFFFLSSTSPISNWLRTSTLSSTCPFSIWALRALAFSRNCALWAGVSVDISSVRKQKGVSHGDKRKTYERRMDSKDKLTKIFIHNARGAISIHKVPWTHLVTRLQISHGVPLKLT
ncbi:hypothetical protein QL285_074830 [Trifolium repens]|nr:hypothetical protein QL285_074830 [Trifolium repens]